MQKKKESSLTPRNRKAQITRSVVSLPEAEDDSRIGGKGSSQGGMGVALSANKTDAIN